MLKRLDPAAVTHIVVHCSATPPDRDINAKDITRWHRERGFLTIGYHWVITRGGLVEPGRSMENPGAHAEGFNHCSIGVCLVGGVDQRNRPDNNFTPEQFDALEALLQTLTHKFPNAEVLGHRDLPGVAKACPSFDVREWAQARGF